MGTVTPTVVAGEGYVRVEANWQDFAHTRKVWIYRSIAGQTALTELREGANTWLSNGIAVAYDHEAPLDTPLTYRSDIALNYNGDFESGVSEWTDTTNNGTIGTVTQSRDYYTPGEGLASAKLTPSGAATSKAVSEIVPITPSARNSNPYFNTNATNWSGIAGATVSRDTGSPHEGSGSLLIVPDGVTNNPAAQSEELTVVAGQTYGWSAWLRISGGGTGAREVGIFWYDAAHALLSSSLQAQSPAATVQTFYSGTAVAPASAAFARLVSRGPGVLAAANTWRIDEAIFWDPSTATVYTILGKLMVPDYWAGGIGVQIQWYSSTTLISTVGALNDLNPFPGNWGTYGFSATDQPGANGFRAVFGIAGSAPETLPLYGDEIYVTRSGTTVLSSPAVVLPSNGGGWWTDPLHPATKVRLQISLDLASCGRGAGVAYLGVTEETFPADSSALEINDAVYPVATWNRRKSGRQGIRVGTQKLADLAAVTALHASGAPLLLQMNATYGEASSYGLHGDLVPARVNGDQREEWRLVGSQFIKVAVPVGPPEGTLKTRYVDLNKYATFGAASAAGATWLDGLRGLLA